MNGPVRASDLKLAFANLTPEEQAEARKLLALDRAVWRPLPGPQTDAYYSPADVVGYGGAAGGGKTDLACGLATTAHWRSVIYRREATQLAGIVDRLVELLRGRNGFSASPRMVWRIPDGRQIDFGSVPHPGDEQKHQGIPHDLVVFDEATNIPGHVVRYLLTWMRSTRAGQRCRALLTFNPPTTAEGRWVVEFFAPWLDDKHPNPAKPGEIRWFAVSPDGADVEVPDARPFVWGEDGERILEFDPRDHAEEDVQRPLSRTFIPSRVGDNLFLASSGYVRTLQSLPEPLRSQMLKGDFLAGVEDDPWQVIPTMWIDLAMARWQPRETAVTRGPMDSMGVDVARGGRDEFIIAKRHGAWVDKLVAEPGVATPDGPTGGGLVLRHRSDRAPVHVDVVGWGAAVYDFLRGIPVQVVAINAAEGSSAITKDGALAFANLRAELWWRLREALDPNGPKPLALPPDPKLRADLAAPKWEHTTRGILIESKDDIKKRLKRSIDRGDAVTYCLRTTPKTQAPGSGRRAGPNGRKRSGWAA